MVFLIIFFFFTFEIIIFLINLERKTGFVSSKTYHLKPFSAYYFLAAEF